MNTEVNILFTGICLFLPQANPPRLIIGRSPGRPTCLPDTGVTIPAHLPYISYSQSQRSGGTKAPFKKSTNHEAVLLSGYVQITGDIVDGTLNFPNGSRELPHVVKIANIAPNYAPLATVEEDDPAKIDPNIVAARLDLPSGNMASPIASESYWHFFPVKGKPHRMKLAQAVTLSFHVRDGRLNVIEQPFGGGAAATIVQLAAGGRSIDITIGNSSSPDIASDSPNVKPPAGADYDFELHWNLFDRNGDPECPPISFNEGKLTSAGLLTLGGGNCPPTQWP